MDANVLIPASIRDLLLWSAEAGLYRPHWSIEVLDELRRNLGPVGKIPDDKVERVIAQMQAAFPGAMTPAWPPERIAALSNHPKDRHVLAVAVESDARYIVTENLRDFRPEDLLPHKVTALTVDDFLLYLLRARKRHLITVLQEMSKRLTRPPRAPLEIVQALSSMAPHFAQAISDALE